MNDASTTPAELEAALRTRIANKAMPLGALGRLETLAVRIGLARGTLTPTPPRACVLVLAGDHGLAIEDEVSAYPAAITGAIAGFVAQGTAGIGICAAAAGIERVTLVDCGLIEPLSPSPPHVLSRRIAAGTRSSRRAPAMTGEQLARCLANGAALATDLHEQGFDTLCLGEIGIGNTAASALLAHATTAIPLDALIGPGAGQTPAGLIRKRQLVREARARALVDDAEAALAEFAGFEMATMAGVMLAAPRHRQIVVVDGFIATAVAAAALRLSPGLSGQLVYAHRSAEPGHDALLRHLDAEPLFDLGLRLGEGTGAALAVPLLSAASRLLTEMADLPGARPL